MFRIVLIVFVLVGSVVAGLPAHAQDGDDVTRYSVTQLGVSFDYPTEWFIAEQQTGIFLSDDQANTRGTVANPAPDSLVLQIGAFTATSLSEFAGYPIADASDAADFFAAAVVQTNGSVLEDTRQYTYADATYNVYVFTDPGLATAFYLFDLATSRGQLILSVTVFAADLDTLQARLPEAETIISSFQSDLADSGTGATPSPDTVSDATTRGMIAAGTGNLAGFVPNDVLQLPDGTVLVGDGAAYYELDLDNGNLGAAMPVPDGNILFAKPAADGTLWAYDADRGLVHLDSDFSELAATGTAPFGDFLATSITVTADRVYVFATRIGADGDQVGRLYIYDTAAFLVDIVVPERVAGDPLSYTLLVNHFALADGTLLQLDSTLISRVIDADGAVIGEGPNIGTASPFLPLPSDVERGPDGRWYVLSYDGLLFMLDAEGELLAQYGVQELTVNNQSDPFVDGVLPFGGKMALLDDGFIIVVGWNSVYGVLSLIDPTGVE